MSEHVEDASEDLARWLSDAGHRTWRPAAVAEPEPKTVAKESTAELFRYLEELAGKELRTREDVRRYVDELSAGAPASRTSQRRRLVKDTALLLCLLTAYIQYNFMDVNLQIARLPSIVIFVPLDAMTRPVRSSSGERLAEPYRTAQSFEVVPSGIILSTPA